MARSAVAPTFDWSQQNPISKSTSGRVWNDVASTSTSRAPVLIEDTADHVEEQTSTRHVISHFLSDSASLRRRVVLATPDSEYDALLRKHGDLVSKRFSEGLSRREELELQLLRWNLDRIEDARSGDYLDQIERIADVQVNFAEKIADLSARWEPATRQRARLKRKGRG